MATRDPYEVLGVPKTASAEEIRRAYRKLAKQNHPDLHPGDRKAEERFKEIAGAYDLLSDADKRARFDRGEIDAAGQERAPRGGFYRDFAQGPDGERYHSREGFASAEEFEDFLSGLFGGRGGGGRTRRARTRGADATYTIAIDFLEAANGAVKNVTLPDGKSLKLTIPAGVQDGQTLRLKGQGQPGFDGGEPGDAFVEVHIRPHAFFRRKDNDIELELPVTLAEAVRGGKVSVPTVSGPVTLTIPPHSNTGTTLRLKGKGIPDRNGQRGDQYVKLKVMLPEQVDPELEKLVDAWAAKHPYDPRRTMSSG